MVTDKGLLIKLVANNREDRKVCIEIPQTTLSQPGRTDAKSMSTATDAESKLQASDAKSIFARRRPEEMDTDLRIDSTRRVGIGGRKGEEATLWTSESLAWLSHAADSETRSPLPRDHEHRDITIYLGLRLGSKVTLRQRPPAVAQHRSRWKRKVCILHSISFPRSCEVDLASITQG